MNGASFRRVLAAVAFAGALGALAGGAAARTTDAPTLREIPAIELPAEARQVLSKIHAGGPFPYERDGVVFGNRERKLPAKPVGYYHEYTVATPGASDRGARRIVCGGPRTAPQACYYTSDHYRSFRRIRQ
jgi:ribonuclease T1